MSQQPILPSLHESVRAAICAHAERTAPQECCGLLVARAEDGMLEYLPGVNLDEGPAGCDRFTLGPKAWVQAEEMGEVVAVVHSHPGASANPSMCDRVMCERSGLPWLIVGVPSGHLVELHPEGWSAPLEGRDFSHGVLDCYTLAQDWYLREWGLELPHAEREDEWWRKGQNLYLDGLAKAGFVPVATREPQRGDGLLMRLNSPDFVTPVENHAAVYLGDGMMLHHLYGQKSRIERWDWPWQRRTTLVVRHERARNGQLLAAAPVEQAA